MFDLLYDGATEEELFDFPDGTTPMGSLLQVNDNIYGVTERGGDHHSGTVFEITRPGSVRRREEQMRCRCIRSRRAACSTPARTTVSPSWASSR